MATTGETLTSQANIMKVVYMPELQAVWHTSSPFMEEVTTGTLGSDPWISEVGGKGDYFYVPMVTAMQSTARGIAEDAYIAAAKKVTTTRARFNAKYSHIPVEFTFQAEQQTSNPGVIVGGNLKELEFQYAAKAMKHELSRQLMAGGDGAYGYIDTATSGATTTITCEPGLYDLTKPFTVTDMVFNILDNSAITSGTTLTTSEILAGTDEAASAITSADPNVVTISSTSITDAVGDTLVRSTAADGTSKAVANIAGWGVDLLGVSALMGWSKLASDVPGNPLYELYGNINRSSTYMLPGFVNNAGASATSNAPFSKYNLDTAILKQSKSGANMSSVRMYMSPEVLIQVARAIQEDQGVKLDSVELKGGWKTPTYETAFCGPLPMVYDEFIRHYRIAMIDMSTMHYTEITPMRWFEWDDKGSILKIHQDSTGVKFNYDAAMYLAHALWCHAPWKQMSIGYISET